MILFDPSTALDALEAFRLLEGRRRIGGKRLAPGVAELRAVAERSLRSLTVAPLARDAEVADDDSVDPHLLTLEDVKARSQFGLTTVKSEIKAGRLKAIHVGRSVRVHSDDYAAWLDRLRSTEQAAS